MTTEYVTSVMNGLRLEHKGGDEITITAEAPTTVGIEVLIKELITFLPSLDGAEGAGNHLLPPPQVPHMHSSTGYQIPGPA